MKIRVYGTRGLCSTYDDILRNEIDSSQRFTNYGDALDYIVRYTNNEYFSDSGIVCLYVVDDETDIILHGVYKENQLDTVD